jgi:molecular chaperone DnaK
VPQAGKRPIEGTAVRSEHSEPPPSGPKPARRSAAPPAGPAPALAMDSEPPISIDPMPASIEPQAVSLQPESAQLGAIVAAGDFFPSQEAFARGSAIATSDNAPLLIDVTPMSLRIETVGGYSDVLITANSPVPCEKARTFLTASDNQTVVFIRVAQGESARFADNTRLGELELSGLTPSPRGAVKIEVTFELDADGILNVRAKDKATDRETKATMRLLGTSTDSAEVDAMAARQARHVVA